MSADRMANLTIRHKNGQQRSILIVILKKKSQTGIRHDHDTIRNKQKIQQYLQNST